MNAAASAFFTVMLAALANTAIADSAPLQLTPAPGKTACQSAMQKLGDTRAKVELCVTQGSFSSDTYLLQIDGKTVLKGIDDNTTKGLTATYGDAEVSLVCTPQNQVPADVSKQMELLQKLTPGMSAEEARQKAVFLETVEIGRLCKVRLGNTLLMEVQVLFE